MPGRAATTPDGPLSEVVRHAARAFEIERYLSALLAPRAAREGLVAVSAGLAEMRRIYLTVGDPALAEIRLQWWRDAISQPRDAGVTGNPIADAFIVALNRHDDMRVLADTILESYQHGVIGGGRMDDTAIHRSLDLQQGNAFRLAAAYLGVEIGRDSDRVIRDAGLAFGLFRLMADTPYLIALDRHPWIAQDAGDLRRRIDTAIAEADAALRRAKSQIRDYNPRLMTAILPVAVVRPHFRGLQTQNRDVTRDIVEISPLTRVTRLFAAHVTRRF